MSMASSQDIIFFLFSTLLLFCVDSVNNCHSSSKALHICFNIYLERDFPIIETILKGQHTTNYGGGRILLEGPDLQNICRNIFVLEECYSGLLKECNSYWQLHRYLKLMDGMKATYAHLCLNSSDNVRDILLNGGCIRRANDLIKKCSHTGISWEKTWKEIFRLQVTPDERCRNLQEYRTCFQSEMKNVYCGREANRVYGDLIALWLDTWCSKSFRPEPTYSVLIVLMVSLVYHLLS